MLTNLFSLTVRVWFFFFFKIFKNEMWMQTIVVNQRGRPKCIWDTATISDSTVWISLSPYMWQNVLGLYRRAIANEET